MDLTTHDITGLSGAGPGAWLALIGPAQSSNHVAQPAGARAYKMPTSLGPRFARIDRPA